MRVTKSDYEMFCYEFERWREEFGLVEYEINFEQSDIDEYATISPSFPDYTCTVTLCRNADGLDIKSTALHECLHLLLDELTGMAHSRFVGKSELMRCEERVVRVLEGVIGGQGV